MNEVFVLQNDGFVQELRQQMVRFARRRLPDATLAEDVVHEALLGALDGASPFAEQSTLKTWVFAILKNKIADGLRRNYRQTAAYDSSPGAATGQALPKIFDDPRSSCIDEHLAYAADPEVALQNRQFCHALEASLCNLSPLQAGVFVLYEVHGRESKDICSTFGMSVSNFHVTLHRARLRLRSDLEKYRPY